jgi:hypothetical protein
MVNMLWHIRIGNIQKEIPKKKVVPYLWKTLASLKKKKKSYVSHASERKATENFQILFHEI